MGERTQRRRECRKKPIGAAELDDLLYRHAQSIFGDAPDPDSTTPDPDTFDLGGYTLSRAFDLWTAWKDHHVMPRRGGYDDQPRRWQRMIHTMNRRFNKAYERAKDEHVPPDPRGGKDGDVLDEMIGAMPFADGAMPSWEQFKGAG